MDDPNRTSSRSRDRSSSFSSMLAHYLDDKFTIPGTNFRFGIDPIIGLIPGFGDWIGAMISVWFLIVAASRGAGYAVMGRMSLNILLDMTIGAIPLLGDIFDVGWKANRRNAQLLEHLEEHPERTIQTSRALLWTMLAGIIILIFGTLFLTIWAFNELLNLLF